MTMSVESIESKIQPWLNAQRIGIAAYSVMVAPRLLRLPTQYENSQKQAELQKFSQNLQLVLYTAWRAHFGGQDDGKEPRLRLEQLPPSVLSLLDTVLTKAPNHVPDDVQKLKDPIKDVLAWLDQTGSAKQGMKSPSPLSKAQIIAYHILDSVASARRIISLGASLGHKTTVRWQSSWDSIADDPACIEHLDLLLQKIRSPLADTRSTLSVLCQLGDILKETLVWPQLENILLTQTFCWPLLVSGDGEHAAGISLPVAVDLTFDGQGEVAVESTQPDGNRQGGVDASQWRHHLERSVEVAKLLWSGKHGNHGIHPNWRSTPDDFRWKVTHASVTFDFSWANRILGNIPASFRDGSANTYFAMAVLARFLGRRGYLSSVVTGLVGEQCRNKESQQEELDFWVTPPSGVAAKLRYLFAARTFERAVLPKGSATENAVEGLLLQQESAEKRAAARGMKSAQTAEVVYGAKLSHLADAVQVGGWRQDRFIRCPELAWALHEDYHARSSRLLDIADPRVQSVLTLLGDNSSPVLDLQDSLDAPPRAVGSALWHINMSLRLRLPRLPPMFSSLFIRATHDQPDSRFWHVVWRAVGAPMADFVQFHRAPSAAQAAAMLAEVFNCFQPLESCPSHRAPDIIVILGVEHFAESLEGVGNPSVRNLSVVPVLNELISQGQLRSAPNAEALEAFLGSTRLILLRDAPDNDLDALAPRAALDELTQAERTALSVLSTFRQGFTHSMASLCLRTMDLAALKHDWGNIHAFLRGLQDKGVLRYGQGWYHLPSSLRDELQQALHAESGEGTGAAGVQFVAYHLAAGKALAPYTLSDTVTAMAFDQALLPEHIYEAFFHFDRAHSLAADAGPQAQRLRQAALHYKTQLLRFAMFPTWSTVASLRQCINAAAFREAYEMGKELVAALEKDKAHPLHPGLYLNVALSGAAWSKDEGRPEVKTTLGEELAGPEGFFERALKACEKPLFQAERDFNRLCVLSAYANYLPRDRPKQAERVQAFDREILGLLDANADARGVRGEWFEEHGDESGSHAQAAHLYRLGVRWVPQWHQLWVKALGATTLALESPDWASAALQEYTAQMGQARRKRGLPSLTLEETMAHILRRAGHRWDASPPPGVKERWNAGVELIRATWGYAPEVQSALREFRTYD